MRIKPLESNLRTCSKCHALYCINGDPSEYWMSTSPVDDNKNYLYPIEGKCEFHRENSKYYIGN